MLKGFKTTKEAVFVLNCYCARRDIEPNLCMGLIPLH